MNLTVSIYGDPGADILLLQPTDDHEMALMEREVSLIREFSGRDFCLKAVPVNSWNLDLSPWKFPAVFGKEDFGGGAPEFLRSLLPEAAGHREVILGGYSLAGLFSLWAGTQTDRFRGIAAASPSVWFPGFTEYLKDRPAQTDHIYLSLGDREERTRNPVMARVGDAIRECETVFREQGIHCTLCWNKGNHFKEPEVRTAKAFAWVMEQL